MIRLAALAMLAAFPAEASCRLALALALDISSSVDESEYAVQIGGLAAAFGHDDIRAALLEQDGEVRVLVFEWSGYYQQDLIVDWTTLTSLADIDRLVGRLEGHRRVYSVYPTAIGRAVAFAAEQFRRLPAPCARLVVDISGDGVNNLSDEPAKVRRTGALDGIVINALVIKGAFPDPEPYYREQVIAGPGSFLMVARNGYGDYPDLIREKLMREIRPPVLVGSLP